MKALSCGASCAVIPDLRKDFVENYVFMAIKANAMYEGRYMMGTAVCRPCISKEQVRIAAEHGAKFISHGATGKGNDQVRFEMNAFALDPHIKAIAPWRDAEFIEKFKGRTDLLAYCEKHKIPVDAKPKANYSVDENLMHVSYESGMLEDAACTPDESMFKMSVSPENAPDEVEKVRVEFKAGVPVKLTSFKDGVDKAKTDPLELFLYANEIGGRNAIGRCDIVENRFVGIKSRGVYETPGGTLLREAHVDLEGIALDKEVKRIQDTVLTPEFSRLCYNGFYFSPEMELIKNSINFAQKDVDGWVEMNLYKGNVIVTGRGSEKTLYSAELASMDIEGGGDALDYNPADAAGFINCNATRLKAYGALRKGK